jgi:phosphate uptake regulator
MTNKSLREALEKHELECSQRFADVERKIDRLDTKLWGLAILIIIASGLEQLI